jgi:ATP adenylyltransferase/5',5'''-P-1,P-4-tetraphosphate phosphorylase II
MQVTPMVETILHFNQAIASSKPNSVHRDSACPFCDTEALTGILDKRESMILLENKYPVLQDAYQTVLIETDQCDSELSEYPLPHLYKLIRFGVEKWMEMEASGRYRSVLFFKNHGPLSGGSIRHPHMQIVGLNTIDYRDNLREEYFIGKTIAKTNGVTYNLSTKPMIGFTEFNVIIEDLGELDQAARFIQITAHYLLNHLRSCTSYNLFFYYWNEKVMVKIVPRFATTPLFVGYGLRQVTNNINNIKNDIQRIYLED